jgi:hypothetical protein
MNCRFGRVGRGVYTQRGAPGCLDPPIIDIRRFRIIQDVKCASRDQRLSRMCVRACVSACVRARASERASERRRDSRRGHGEPAKRVASIFPDCTTTVVCGCVNRSQSKYICTHIRNAARRTLRLVMQSCVSCLAQFRHSLCPALCAKCGNEFRDQT